jgi:hypothetical protein
VAALKRPGVKAVGPDGKERRSRGAAAALEVYDPSRDRSPAVDPRLHRRRLLLMVLVDGWAVGFLPRLVEKLVILAAFLIVAALVVVGLMGRDGGVFFSREDARRLDD